MLLQETRLHCQLKLAPLKVFCSDFVKTKSNFLKIDPQQLRIIFGTDSNGCF